MCNYCSKIKPKDYPTPCKAFPDVPEFKNDDLFDSLGSVIKGDILHLDYSAYSCDSSFSEEIKIKFCPMCGKKLS